VLSAAGVSAIRFSLLRAGLEVGPVPFNKPNQRRLKNRFCELLQRRLFNVEHYENPFYKCARFGLLKVAYSDTVFARLQVTRQAKSTGRLELLHPQRRAE
jgi:hypothetical protein